MKPDLKIFQNMVAAENNQIIGYAYASAFNERAAYERAVETTNPKPFIPIYDLKELQ